MPITLNRRHILAGLPALVAGLRATPAARPNRRRK